MSHLVNPMSISLTLGEGGASTPFSQISHVVGAEPEPIHMGGEGRVPKRGKAVVGLVVEVGVSPGGVRHVPSRNRSRMSLIVRGGSEGLCMHGPTPPRV